MGYQVYWENGRWQGYGVPAYCDHVGCFEEIDRGIAYQHPDTEFVNPSIFTCEKHRYCSLEEFDINLLKEHPDWLNHILTDESWAEWRNLHPEAVEEYKLLLKESENESTI